MDCSIRIGGIEKALQVRERQAKSGRPYWVYKHKVHFGDKTWFVDLRLVDMSVEPIEGYKEIKRADAAKRREKAHASEQRCLTAADIDPATGAFYKGIIHD